MEPGRLWPGLDYEEGRLFDTSWYSFDGLFQAEIPSFFKGGFDEGLRFGCIFAHQVSRIPIELFFGAESIVG